MGYLIVFILEIIEYYLQSDCLSELLSNLEYGPKRVILVALKTIV